MTAPTRQIAHSLAHAPGWVILPGLIGVILLLAGDAVGILWLTVTAVVALLVGQYRARQAAEQQVRAAELYRIRSIQSTEIARYHAMNPNEFEHAVAFLCQRDGCTDVSVVGGAGDLGADVIATGPDGRRIVVQCKRYGPTTKVGSPDMQRFGGTCYSVHGAHVAVVVTTSVFTRPAVNYGHQQGIRIVDGSALAAWATRTGPAPWM
ncbi:restriction endonuclease [Streptomyces sp. NBC_00820]|uniref:restriction endonuclease n=1 Tax=Streptomyces sp. NBC_00820 TaxID=2975842 RepID=UPI002ED393D1|nr:restriction endonuclease [Streptomyces sp. NBC_00820]